MDASTAEAPLPKFGGWLQKMRGDSSWRKKYQRRYFTLEGGVQGC
jgi:hypothetical protein